MRFIAAWPEVRRRVVASSVARGTPRHAAEDVAQEVAVRAYRTQPPFTSPDELFAWCSTVGRRWAIDQHRKEHRVDAVATVPERVESDTPEARFERQQLVRAVLTRFSQLPAAQRGALLGVEAPADYVRRHRARRHLLAVVEAFGAVVAGVWAKVRSSRSAVLVSAVVTASVVVVVGSALWSVVPPATSIPLAAGNEPVRVLTPSTTSTIAASPRVAPKAPATAHQTIHRVAAPTPVGTAWIDVAKNQGQPLLCAWKRSLEVHVCIDYPRLP